MLRRMDWRWGVCVGMILLSSVLLSCGEGRNKTDKQLNAEKKVTENKWNGHRIVENTVVENDSVAITMKFFPAKDEWSPGATEVWKTNKKKGISKLLVKSNPDSLYGEVLPYKYENDSYRVYPVDSIPTIFECIPVPNTTFLILEGQTCDFGWIATFKIDWVTGQCYVLPSNNGFREFESETNNIIVASRFNDVDPLTVIWYEKLYTINHKGEIIKVRSDRNSQVESYLPDMHLDADFDVKDIKLLNLTTLRPKHPDDYFWGNKFECEYIVFNDTTVNKLEQLTKTHKDWKKEGSHYRYSNVENGKNENAFLWIDIDIKQKKGIVYKGMFSDERNLPEVLRGGSPLSN